MAQSKQLQQSLTQLLYSVIERGVCRIVTSHQPSLLPDLMYAYEQSIPEHHNILWLKGKIDDIDDLKHALINAGINELQDSHDSHSYIETCQAYLTKQHQAGINEIWALTDVNHLAPDVHSLLSTLMAFTYLKSPVLSLELWGNAQLDVFYQSGVIEQAYKCPIYPIKLGQDVLQIAPDNKRMYATIAACLFVGTIVGVVGSYPFYSKTNEHALVETSKVGAKDENEATITSLPTAEDNSTQQQIAVSDAQHNTDAEGALTTEVATTQNTGGSEAPNALKTQPTDAETSEPHWYYALSEQEWQAPGEFSIATQSANAEGEFFLQFGVFKQQSSLLRFFELNQDQAQQFTICYVDDWGSTVIISPGFASYDDISAEYQRLTEQAYDLAMIDHDNISSWQCNYNVSLGTQSVVASVQPPPP